MLGYSGTAEFQFEIEREIDGEYKIIVLQIEGRSYFTPGKFHALPENCYPDEGETEVTSVLGPDGKDWSANLSDSENDSILEMIQEQAHEGGEPDFDDYDDGPADSFDPTDAYDF
jgi:hypothetical protein